MNQYGSIKTNPGEDFTVEVYDDNGVRAYIRSPGGVYCPAYMATLDEVEIALKNSLESVAKLKKICGDAKDGEKAI
jgi:hypothetical protein